MTSLTFLVSCLVLQNGVKYITKGHSGNKYKKNIFRLVEDRDVSAQVIAQRQWELTWYSKNKKPSQKLKYHNQENYINTELYNDIDVIISRSFYVYNNNLIFLIITLRNATYSFIL